MKQKEFLAIVLPIKDKLYRIAKRLLISEDESEDAVQEVLLKLWKGKNKIASYKNPEAFAVTMTKNYCLDRLKSKQASNLKIVPSNFKSYDTLQKKIELNDEVRLLVKLLETLPEKQKVIVQLRDIEQYEFSEIAEILGSSQATIRVTLSRARKAIKEQLIKHYNYGVK